MRIVSSSFETLPEIISEKLADTEITFFSTLSWYRNFVDTIIEKDAQQYSFLIAEENHQPCIIFPIKFSTTTTGCRQLSSLSNYYSPIFQIFHNKLSSSLAEALKKFFKELKTGPIEWDTLEIRPLSHEDHSIISDQLKNANISFVPFFCFGNWYLEVNGRFFDDYFSGLSSRVKNTIKRKTKQFEKLAGSKVIIFSSPNELGSAISAYEKIYCSSWKNEEPYPDFIRGLIRMTGAKGILRLGIAYLNETAIAAQIWIVNGKTAYIFKLAYIEEYKHMSAGSILTAKLLQHVIDIDKVDTVDYLSGDDPYKKDWMSHRRERWGILAFNTTTIHGKLEMITEKSRFYLKKCWQYLKRPFILKNFH